MRDASQDIDKLWVIFILKEQQFALPITAVREMMNQPKVAPLPDVPEYILGEVNIRGQALPLLDLRTRLSIVTRHEEKVDYLAHLSAFEREHRSLFSMLARSIKEGREFRMPLAVDECSFDSWVKDVTSDDLIMSTEISRLVEPHRIYHEALVKAHALYKEEENPEAALKVIAAAREQEQVVLLDQFDKARKTIREGAREIALVISGDPQDYAISVDQLQGVEELEINEDDDPSHFFLDLEHIMIHAIGKRPGVNELVVMLDAEALLPSDERGNLHQLIESGAALRDTALEEATEATQEESPNLRQEDLSEELETPDPFSETEFAADLNTGLEAETGDELLADVDTGMGAEGAGEEDAATDAMDATTGDDFDLTVEPSSDTPAETETDAPAEAAMDWAGEETDEWTVPLPEDPIGAGESAEAPEPPLEEAFAPLDELETEATDALPEMEADAEAEIDSDSEFQVEEEPEATDALPEMEADAEAEIDSDSEFQVEEEPEATDVLPEMEVEAETEIDSDSEFQVEAEPEATDALPEMEVEAETEIDSDSEFQVEAEPEAMWGDAENLEAQEAGEPTDDVMDDNQFPLEASTEAEAEPDIGADTTELDIGGEPGESIEAVEDFPEQESVTEDALEEATEEDIEDISVAREVEEEGLADLEAIDGADTTELDIGEEPEAPIEAAEDFPGQEGEFTETSADTEAFTNEESQRDDLSGFAEDVEDKEESQVEFTEFGSVASDVQAGESLLEDDRSDEAIADQDSGDSGESEDISLATGETAGDENVGADGDSGDKDASGGGDDGWEAMEEAQGEASEGVLLEDDASGMIETDEEALRDEEETPELSTLETQSDELEDSGETDDGFTDMESSADDLPKTDADEIGEMASYLNEEEIGESGLEEGAPLTYSEFEDVASDVAEGDSVVESHAADEEGADEVPRESSGEGEAEGETTEVAEAEIEATVETEEEATEVAMEADETGSLPAGDDAQYSESTEAEATFFDEAAETSGTTAETLTLNEMPVGGESLLNGDTDDEAPAFGDDTDLSLQNSVSLEGEVGLEPSSMLSEEIIPGEEALPEQMAQEMEGSIVTDINPDAELEELEADMIEVKGEEELPEALMVEEDVEEEGPEEEPEAEIEEGYEPGETEQTQDGISLTTIEEEPSEFGVELGESPEDTTLGEQFTVSEPEGDGEPEVGSEPEGDGETEGAGEPEDAGEDGTAEYEAGPNADQEAGMETEIAVEEADAEDEAPASPVGAVVTEPEFIDPVSANIHSRSTEEKVNWVDHEGLEGVSPYSTWSVPREPEDLIQDEAQQLEDTEPDLMSEEALVGIDPLEGPDAGAEETQAESEGFEDEAPVADTNVADEGDAEQDTMSEEALEGIDPLDGPSAMEEGPALESEDFTEGTPSDESMEMEGVTAEADIMSEEALAGIDPLNGPSGMEEENIQSEGFSEEGTLASSPRFEEAHEGDAEESAEMAASELPESVDLDNEEESGIRVEVSGMAGLANGEEAVESEGMTESGEVAESEGMTESGEDEPHDTPPDEPDRVEPVYSISFPHEGEPDTEEGDAVSLQEDIPGEDTESESTGVEDSLDSPFGQDTQDTSTLDEVPPEEDDQHRRPLPIQDTEPLAAPPEDLEAQAALDESIQSLDVEPLAAGDELANADEDDIHKQTLPIPPEEATTWENMESGESEGVAGEEDQDEHRRPLPIPDTEPLAAPPEDLEAKAALDESIQSLDVEPLAAGEELSNADEDDIHKQTLPIPPEEATTWENMESGESEGVAGEEGQDEHRRPLPIPDTEPLAAPPEDLEAQAALDESIHSLDVEPLAAGEELANADEDDIHKQTLPIPPDEANENESDTLAQMDDVEPLVAESDETDEASTMQAETEETGTGEADTAVAETGELSGDWEPEQPEEPDTSAEFGDEATPQAEEAPAEEEGFTFDTAETEAQMPDDETTVSTMEQSTEPDIDEEHAVTEPDMAEKPPEKPETPQNLQKLEGFKINPVRVFWE